MERILSGECVYDDCGSPPLHGIADNERDRGRYVRDLEIAFIGDRKILSPGVGAQGGSASSAIQAGADYVIVGRAIYSIVLQRQ